MFNSFDPKMLLPVGADYPDIYIVGEAPNIEEIKDNSLLANASGRALLYMLKNIGTQKWRYMTLLLGPTHDKNGNKYPISDKRVAHDAEFVKADIMKRKPKCIIIFGSYTVKGFLPEKAEIPLSEIVNIQFEFNSIPLYVVYSPTYVLRNSSVHSIAFMEYTEKFRSYFIKYSDVKATKKELDFIIPPYQLVRMDEVDNLFDIFPEEEINLDYEASSLSVYNPGLKLVGIGLGTMDKRVYIPCNWYKQKGEFHDTFARFLSSKKIVNVYNASYEFGVTKNLFDIEIFSVCDVWALLRVLGLSGSLKLVASVKLGVSKWDQVWEIDKRLQKIVAIWWTHPSYYLDDLVNLNDNQTLYWKNLNQNLKELQDLLKDDYVSVVSEVQDCVKRHTYKPENCLEFIPVPTVAEYCSMDAFILSPLKDKLWGEMNDDEKKATYSVYMPQIKLACELEKNCVTWDEDYADFLDKFYRSVQKLALVGILTNPLFVKTNNINVLQVLNNTFKQNLAIYNPSGTHPNTRKMFLDAIMTSWFRFRLYADKIIEIAKDNDYGTFSIIKQKIKEEGYTLDDVVDNFILKQPMPRDIKDALVSYQIDYSSMDNQVIEKFYELIFDGKVVNIEDPNTWNNEAWLLVWYRYFKKTLKMSNSYIYGNQIGHGKVWDCEYDETGYPVRISSYTPKKGPKVLQGEFFALGITTKRWSSGVHCLSGNVKIPTLEYGNIPISELKDKITELDKPQTYTIDEASGSIVPNKINNIIEQGKVTSLMELEFDNGFKVRCTPNHRFLTKSGDYIEAQFIDSETELEEIDIKTIEA